MSEEVRFLGPVPGISEGRSVFAHDDFTTRMDKVRLKILDVRRAWKNELEYQALKGEIRDFVGKEHQDEVVAEKIEELLRDFQDYADMDLKRTTGNRTEKYPALELYCTKAGYDYLYRLVYSVLRNERVNEALLLTAVTFVEYLTIDLYNLRLANIGDPAFANYQGITYRGMRVTPGAAEDYRDVFKQKDLRKRNFSIPLGLMSSSTRSDTMKLFAHYGSDASRTDKIYFTIHVHGIDRDLLALYLRDYPTSVVTTICAMPVGRISPYAEQEILLRGAFFHIIDMNSQIIDEENVHEILCVVINANRDHTTEEGSNEGPKKIQRDIFRHLVAASRYEVCAKLAAEYKPDDAETYADLQKTEIEAAKRLREENLHSTPRLLQGEFVQNTDLANKRSEAKATWLGGSTVDSYPRPYSNLRMLWEDAIAEGRWCEVEEILERDYIWSKSEWYHVGRMQREGPAMQSNRDGYSLLHEIALQGPPNEKDQFFLCWQSLVERIVQDESWKTLRTFDDTAKTAQQIAVEQGYLTLAEQLAPRIKHEIPNDTLERLQTEVHEFMSARAGSLIRQYGFRLPQLSVLTEMEVPSLWVPIPNMFGGFLIQLNNSGVDVSVFETVPGYYQPSKTTHTFQ